MTKINRVTEIIGEDGLRMVAQTLGLEDWKLSWKRQNNGPDFWGKNSSLDIFGMFEAKGGSSKLSEGAKYGDQMNHDWIKHWYVEVGKKYKAVDTWQKQQIRNAYSNREPLLTMVASLDFHRANRSGASNLLDNDELRIGFQVWTFEKTAWEEWETKDKKSNGLKHLGF
ncbi:hypothetical protein [Symmachiella dynata]|uniref:hypothetical protein n=1 Tax=Symmachiella dynata TaxID=2527995 RepID=UPI0030EE46C9